MSSLTARSDAREVTFASSIPRFVNAGSIRFITCGTTIRRIVIHGVIPIAFAPSHWPRSIETMPPRKISAQ